MKTDETIEEEMQKDSTENIESILFCNNDLKLKKKALKELIGRALMDEYYWKDL